MYVKTRIPVFLLFFQMVSVMFTEAETLNESEMADINERVARMEGELKSVNETVLSIKGYLERATIERTSHHTLVIERLTRTEAKQDAMAANVEKYQHECTSDRKLYEDRITEVEKVQSNAKAVGGAIAAVISAVIVTTGLAVDYFRKN